MCSVTLSVQQCWGVVSLVLRPPVCCISVAVCTGRGMSGLLLVKCVCM